MQIIKQGGAAFNWSDTPYGKTCWIGVIVGSGAALISAVVFVPLIRKRVALDLEMEKAAAEAAVAAAAEGGVGAADAATGDKPQGKEAGEGSSSDGEHAAQQHAPEVADVTTPPMLRSVRKSRVWSAITKSANFDIHEVSLTRNLLPLAACGLREPGAGQEPGPGMCCGAAGGGGSACVLSLCTGAGPCPLHSPRDS